MNTDNPAVDINTDFYDVVKIMRQKWCRRLPVVKDKLLAGLITETDIVNATLKLEEELNSKLAKGGINLSSYKKKQKELVSRLKDFKQYKKLDSGIPKLNDLLGGGYSIGTKASPAMRKVSYSIIS